MKIQLYGKPNCGLCEEAVETLKLVQQHIDFTIEHINIENNDELYEAYGLMIPVVIYNKEIVQYGRIDYPTVLEKLRAVQQS